MSNVPLPLRGEQFAARRRIGFRFQACEAAPAHPDNYIQFTLITNRCHPGAHIFQRKMLWQQKYIFSAQLPTPLTKNVKPSF